MLPLFPTVYLPLQSLRCGGAAQLLENTLLNISLGQPWLLHYHAFSSLIVTNSRFVQNVQIIFQPFDFVADLTNCHRLPLPRGREGAKL